MIAAARLSREIVRGRKVRTPQGSVPDNVRGLRFKTQVRPVPQKIYRPAPKELGKGEKVR